MKATVVDLRYRMNDVLKALDRNEDVAILYRGRQRGVLRAETCKSEMKVTSHPFFGMRRSVRAVEEELEALRGGRCRDL